MTKKKRNSLSYGNNESVIEKLSYHISTGIGQFFYKLGMLVAKNPLKVISMCLLSVLLSSLGFLNFYQERDPLKLWVPDNIDFHKHTKFIMNNYREGIRIENVLIISDNVLTPKIFDIQRRIVEAIYDIKIVGEQGNEMNLDKLCFKVPLIAEYANLMSGQQQLIDGGEKRRRKRAINDTNDDEENFDFLDLLKNNPEEFMRRVTDPSFTLTSKQYCSIVNKLKFGCMHENILEMWSEPKLNLTREEILDKLNSIKINEVTGHDTNFASMLSGIERDESGRIVAAKALLSAFNLHLNFSEVNLDRTGNAAGTEELTTVNIMRFEEKFLLLMEKLQSEFKKENVSIFYGSGRSYGDISAKTLFQDINKLSLGIVLMSVYIIIILSKFSWPEMRFSLTAIGILNVGMAYVSGCGLSSFFFFYSPVHASLFFIILGLGVDDIFVIMAAFRKINSEQSDLSLEEKIAKTMQKAGASITVTSLTDIIAFLVGSSTILPSLRSFCIFAAICILMTYLYVVTFFVAVLTIDEKRTLQNRNGLIPCIVHEDRTPSCEPKLMSRFLHFFYGKFVLTKVGKVTVILAVVGLMGFSVDRALKIKQKFDPMWFIPKSTYYYEFFEQYRDFYPERGYSAGVYMGGLDYAQDLPRIIEMSKELESRTDLITKVQSWPRAFSEYVNDVEGVDVKQVPLNDTQWSDYLSKFLFSMDGGKFQQNFKFEKELKCGQPAGKILISSITFNFHKFDSRDKFLPAKAAIENIVSIANFSRTEAFMWGRILGNWFTDEIIDSEIYRNIALALVGVFICTAIMIVNVQVCLYIFICVLLSLVSVGGFMQLWGLTLDIVTSIGLQLSVGLCIDYAAHIGHTFLTISNEDGNLRALETVETIGGAVLQGGGSTALSIMILSTSDAYTFNTFFKIFTIVVIFGLFYGTVFLPVILSIFKPKPYSPASNLNNANGDIDTELVLIAKQKFRIMSQNDKSCDNE